MTRLKLEFTGLLDMVDVLGASARRLEDDREVMEEIGDYGRASVVETFLAQGRPEPWADLAPSTLQRRESEGNFSTLILRDSDTTMQSFAGEGNEYTIFDVENHLVEWGNSRFDFPYHQEGSSSEPERIILQHLQEDVDLYAEKYVDYVIQPFEE